VGGVPQGLSGQNCGMMGGMDDRGSVTARRTRMSWAPRPKPGPRRDPLDDLIPFLLRVSPADEELANAYRAAKARASAEWANYGAWLNNEREPYPVVPQGPDKANLPGLELALRIQAKRFSDRPGYREEWRP
jgi:hypothetical protein